MVDLDVGLEAEGTRDHRSLRMDAGLLVGEPSVPLHLGHEAVVLGELRELTVAQQVAARIAHVHEREQVLAVLLDDSHGGDRGAHAPFVGLVLRELPDGAVGRLDGLDEAVDSGRVERGLERVGRGLRRHLTRLVTSEPVADRVDPVGDEVAVLVDVAHQANVGGGSGRQRDQARGFLNG